MTKTLNELADAIWLWQTETFPEQTAKGCYRKLRQEALELLEAWEDGDDEGVAEELADCFFMAVAHERLTPGCLSSRIFVDDSPRDLVEAVCFNIWVDPESMRPAVQRLARMMGVDLAAAVEAKLTKNKARKWPKKPAADGTYSHVKEGQSDDD